MAKVIRLQPDYNYNHETSDLSPNSKYQQQIEQISQETQDALNTFPGINTIKLTEGKKREIYYTLENTTIHPNTIKTLEEKSNTFDPTQVDISLTKQELTEEMANIISPKDFQYRQQLQAA